MQIIVIERDAALGLFLQKGLAIAGHRVSWTDSTEEALTMAQSEAPNLIVLDVASQEEMDLLTSLQSLHPRTSILALVGRNTVEDRVRCLDLGADDCITKPFSFHELTARCRALLRRQALTSDGGAVLTHGDLHLDRMSRETSVGGQPLHLTAKEFRLLEFLLRNAGRCCSRGELLKEVFQLSPDNATNVVDVYINYLRKKLSQAEGRLHIVTVRGAGYCLAPAERIKARAVPRETSDQYATA